LSYCPSCGNKVDEDEEYCSECGHNLKGESLSDLGPDVDAVGHLTQALNLSMNKPMVFLPTILGGIISSILGWIAVSMGYAAYRSENFSGFAVIGVLFSLLGVFFVYILSFASIDMGRDAYLNKPLSLGESINYVLSRLMEFIMASIVGAILALTIILIPVVLLMFVIMVMDETGISQALSRAFSLLGAELGDIIVVILVSIVGSAILSYVPFISGLLQSALTVIINLAFIDMYFKYKE
jgi:hypothetical protein